MQNTCSTSTLLKRGFCGKCPACGQGKLFTSYLKLTPTCAACGADFSTIRADDGPAWLTILLTGHILAPIVTYCAMSDTLDPTKAMVGLTAFTLGLVFWLLPRTKGVFVAMIWRSRQKQLPDV